MNWSEAAGFEKIHQEIDEWGIFSVSVARRRHEMKLRALKASAFLSTLFLVVYHTCNWITAQRTDVGTIYFGWERMIPFMPFFILPYMSVDLFFVVAPFLCADESELRAFSRRIALAIIVAGACFLLFPLQLAVERPQPDGWLGVIFVNFCKIDRPYNLLPSLHIALCTILAVHYARHTSGIWRVVSNVWFALIALSALLTYQHHFIDVAGGFILAVLCFYFVRERPAVSAVTPNPRLGWIYAVGAVVLFAAALWLRGWGWLLLWPTFATAMVAAAYFGIGPAIYRKENGRLHWSARLLLAPAIFGQRLSLWHYQRQCRPWDEVSPEVWIGRQLNDGEAAAAVRAGVTAVLDLTSEFSEATPFRALAYQNVAILDLTGPTGPQLREAVCFIDSHAATGRVYVHCKIGYSRSAAVIGAWLVAGGAARTADEAIARLRAVRPSIVIRPEAETAMREFADAAARPPLS